MIRDILYKVFKFKLVSTCLMFYKLRPLTSHGKSSASPTRDILDRNFQNILLHKKTQIRIYYKTDCDTEIIK